MKAFYKKLYQLLDQITPLLVDCGELCSKRCCQKEIGQGIFLFPDEAGMFAGKPYWQPVQQIEGMEAVSCDGNCPREERPLFCRIFPLFPYLDETGELLLTFYSPFNFICPLVKLEDFSLLAQDYLEALEEVGHLLSQNPDCREFLEKISRRIDAYEAEPWTALV